MATLSLDKLNKRYDNGYEAVRELDLEVDDGEFLVLVGPSGCGKSTVLRMVAGLEEITAGEMRIDGVRVNERGPQQRDIAMVFQSYALYPNMTVAQNIAFAMTLKKVPKAEIARKVNEVAQMLELGAVLDRKPGQLSGGQRQRVAMGRAIVREPRLFLMDEPLSNLDAQLRVQTRAEISRLQHRLNITTLYVTHDQVEAMTMGDRVAVLRRGELMQCASPRVLYETPANLFVAQFIGSPSMNVVLGEVFGTGDELGIRIGDQDLRVDAAALADLPGLAGMVGRRVGVGLRPGAVGSDGASSLDVTVELVEMLGSELLVHTTLAAPAVTQNDEGVHVAAAPTSVFVASLDTRREVNVGERLTLAVDTTRMHLFDLETGEAIGRRPN